MKQFLSYNEHKLFQKIKKYSKKTEKTNKFTKKCKIFWWYQKKVRFC